MDSKINKGRIEFNDENYEKALTYFDAVDESDEDYDYVLIFKITCLMELERYDKALFLIDSLLAEDPGDELLLYEKIRCHIALEEKDDAISTLKEFEKVIAKDNKRMILDVARFYKILCEFKKALRFCNMALSIDEDFKDAIYEKALIGIALNNKEIIDNCANKLLRLVGDDKSNFMPIFLLKLYSDNFKDCMDIIEDLGKFLDDQTCNLLKTVIFNQLSENLDVNIYLTEEGYISISEAIELLIDFDEFGTKYGIINDVAYVIM